MAGNSSIFESRKTQNEDNLKRWQDWSVSINYVVDQFNDVITNLTERLNTAEVGIESLHYKIVKGATTDYVKLQYNDMQLQSSDKTTYAKPCGVFSNVSTGANIFYVYSNKTVAGLYVNDNAVKYIQQSDEHHNEYNVPFADFSGADLGTILLFKSNNAAKVTGDIKLYFSLNPSLNINGNISDSTDTLTLKLNFNSVTTKKLQTLDKSQLSKAIVKNMPIIANQDPITKVAAIVGQYSTVKTVATAAEQQSDVKNRN